MKLTLAQFRELEKRLARKAGESVCKAPEPPPTKSKTLQRYEEAYNSLASAKMDASWDDQGRFFASYLGAHILSLNELLRLDLRSINGYRKLWHKKAEESRLLTGKHRHSTIAGAVRLTLYRQGKKLIDNDAMPAAFKFAIDGFKEAGLIVDDNPKVVQEILFQQRTGPYAVAMLFEDTQLPRNDELIQLLFQRTQP